MPAAGSQQQRLIELQQRVFDEVCSTPADRMVALHCALRAQQATPSLGQRCAKPTEQLEASRVATC